MNENNRMIKCKAAVGILETSADTAPQHIIILPQSASKKLSSRSTVMVNGLIDGFHFQTALEPDGQMSHWFVISKDMLKRLSLKTGDIVNLEIAPTKQWPEPEIPADLQQALAADPDAHSTWQNTTAMARWEWVRWLDAVILPETRKVRPSKLCSMLASGKRRPCCFNRAMRTPPKSAMLT